MAARARSEPQWRSKWPLEPSLVPLGWGARNRCSSPPRSSWGARNSRSSPVGVAGALEMAARAPSASLGGSKWPQEPDRPRWGGRNRCSGPLGFAEALTLAARVRSASLGRSKWLLELALARLRLGGRNRCSGLLSLPRWGVRQLHIFVDVPNLFQLSVLRRAGIKFICIMEPLEKSTKICIFFVCPTTGSQIHIFVDVPNVFLLPVTAISKHGVHKQKFLLS